MPERDHHTKHIGTQVPHIKRIHSSPNPQIDFAASKQQIAGAMTSLNHSTKDQGSTRTLRTEWRRWSAKQKRGNALALPLPTRHYRPKRSSTATRKYGASSRCPYPQSSTGVCILPRSVEILIRHHLPRRRHRHTAPKIHWKIRLPGSRQCRDISSSELTLIRRIMHTRSPIVETVGHFGLQPPLRVKPRAPTLPSIPRHEAMNVGPLKVSLHVLVVGCF
jgi:hypothetical protein